MFINLRREKCAKAWALRLLFGPATIIDGVVQTITLGTFNPGLALKAARQLAWQRMAHEQRKTEFKNAME